MVERKTVEYQDGEEKRVALIKSLITRDRKDALEAQLHKIELNLSADTIFYWIASWLRYLSLPNHLVSFVSILS